MWGSTRPEEQHDTVTPAELGAAGVTAPHAENHAGWAPPSHEAPELRDGETPEALSGPPTSQRLTVSGEGEGGPSSVMFGGPGAVPAVFHSTGQPRIHLYQGASCGTGELPELPFKPQSAAPRQSCRNEEQPAGGRAAPEEATGGLQDEWWGPSEIEARRLHLVEHLDNPGPKALPSGLMSLIPAQEHREGSRALLTSVPCCHAVMRRGPVCRSPTHHSMHDSHAWHASAVCRLPSHCAMCSSTPCQLSC